MRLFNTVGPRQVGRYGMVLPNFVRQALANEPLTVFGDGSQSRCFCHVRDAVRALIDLLTMEQTAGEVYNVGSDEEVTIKELASRVIEMTNSPSRISFIPYEEAYAPGFEDMRRRVPDLRKVRKAIGFSPSYDLDGIIRSAVSHHQTSSSP